MKKNDDIDILSDLESDLDKDWDDISKEIYWKEEQERRHQEQVDIKNNPRRLNLSYKRFYELMWIFYNQRNSSREIENMLHELSANTLYSDQHLPKVFEHLWDMLCEPHGYEIATGIVCKSCKKRYDVFLKERHRRRYRPLEGMEMAMTIEREREYAHCPYCGYRFIGFNDVEIIGVFTHVHFDESEEYRGENDIKQKFESYF